MKNPLIHSPFNELLNLLSTFELDSNEDNKQLIEEYLNHIKSINVDLEQISKLETLILQINASKFTHNDIKLTIVGDYVNARIICFRKDVKSDDIRMVLGPISEIGSDLTSIRNNEELMSTAYYTLSNKILNEIEQNNK